MCGGQKKADLPLKMQVAKVVKMRREKQKRLSRDVRLRNTSLIKRVSMMILVADQRNYIRRKQ